MAVTTGTFNLVSAAEVISKHGLDPNGRAQKFLTHQARVLMDPYVPFRSGTLKNSAVERPTSVNYVTPYAGSTTRIKAAGSVVPTGTNGCTQ